MNLFRTVTILSLMAISSMTLAEDGSERSLRMNEEFRAKQQELKEDRERHELERIHEEKLGSVSAMPNARRIGGN